ncbi:hypothetical protein, partial [Klebsiella pneumoniae]|uniref:hypothetical protein n=1 Tax=Klebsiella pneumoniae TaxID=573 RepID=UPI001C54B9A0
WQLPSAKRGMSKVLSPTDYFANSGQDRAASMRPQNDVTLKTAGFEWVHVAAPISKKGDE